MTVARVPVLQHPHLPAGRQPDNRREKRSLAFSRSSNDVRSSFLTTRNSSPSITTRRFRSLLLLRCAAEAISRNAPAFSCRPSVVKTRLVVKQKTFFSRTGLSMTTEHQATGRRYGACASRSYHHYQRSPKTKQSERGKEGRKAPTDGNIYLRSML